MTKSAIALMKTSARDFAQKEHGHFIANEWFSSGDNSFDVIDPSSGQPFTRVRQAGKAEVDGAVGAAKKAFDDGVWWKLSPSKRAQILWRTAELITEHGDILAELESLDAGKPLKVARHADVALAADHFRYYAGLVGRLEGDVVSMFGEGLSKSDHHSYTKYEPVGVAGLIIPWNFPLLIAAWKLAPALAAGCSMVLKPAENTPLSATYLVGLIKASGMPAGVVNMIHGDGRAGALLCEHQGIDKISFTGSTEVGKLIVKAASANLKRLSLELGGKSPAIIFADADIDAAIKAASNGIFFNHGQCCAAGSRLYAHESIFADVVAGLKKRASGIRVGVGMDESTHMGPLISQAQKDKVLGFVEAGKKHGGEVVCGAEIGDQGYFVAPTVLSRVPEHTPAMKEEIFGPVVCVNSFTHEEEVIAKANDTDYGLAAGIYTNDLARAHRVSSKLKAGTVWVNSYNIFDANLPFGGFKQSGWGREMGLDGLKLYTEKKSVCIELGKK